MRPRAAVADVRATHTMGGGGGGWCSTNVLPCAFGTIEFIIFIRRYVRFFFCSYTYLKVYTTIDNVSCTVPDIRDIMDVNVPRGLPERVGGLRGVCDT